MSSFSFNIFSQAIQQKVARTELVKDEMLFLEGTKAESIHMVEEGCVRFFVNPQDGKQLVLYRARSGEPFAEEHLSLEDYSYSAMADKPSIVQSIEKKDLLNDICSNPEVAKRFINCLSGRYYQLRTSFERLGISSARDRVLHFISASCDAQNRKIELSGKLKSLSDDLNLSHEAVYRALRELESDGTIKRNDGVIEILRM